MLATSSRRDCRDAYADPVHPTHIGMKAKGHDFHSPHHTPQFLREHLIYIQLPQPLRSGSTYTLHLGELVGNLNTYSFTFDEHNLRSPTVRTSHVGYRPEAPKHAYFSQWMGTFNTPDHPKGALNLSRYVNGTFHIINTDTGRTVRTLNGLQLQKSREVPDPANRHWTLADIYSLDFSDLREPGRYVVVAERTGRSWPFEIGDHVYEDAHRATMRSVFFQRRGICGLLGLRPSLILGCRWARKRGLGRQQHPSRNRAMRPWRRCPRTNGPICRLWTRCLEKG